MALNWESLLCFYWFERNLAMNAFNQTLITFLACFISVFFRLSKAEATFARPRMAAALLKAEQCKFEASYL